MSEDIEIPDINKKLNSNNYFSNCYIHLTKKKQIHFIFLLIEILLNIFQELEIILRGFYLSNTTNTNIGLNFVSIITSIFDGLKSSIKFIILLPIILIFDSLYFILKIKKFKTKYIYISIIVNILELFIFRVFSLLLFNMIFKFDTIFFSMTCLLLIPHIYLIMNNFIYNHLYYFVPEFIEYPYDAFSSLYDIVLLLIKIFLSFSATATDSGKGKFGFLILFSLQIVFSLYFINKLINHSYLFMKNSFLNISKVSFFLSKTVIILIALLLDKSEIKKAKFLIISICILLISMSYMYFFYNPYSYIIIKKEKTMENIFFYLYILSQKNNYDFFFENKVKEHYERCSICDLCKRYEKYFNTNKTTKNNNDEEDEKEAFIKDNIGNNEDKLIDLFDIVCDNKNKYFQLIKKISSNYKQKGKDSFHNNSYYYINLSFLIYHDYPKNLNLSLNERILLDIINQENKAFLDNHEAQILKILLCNEFISLSNQILIQLKDILNSEPNFNKAKKLIELSLILKKMKNKKYKDNLFSHKSENISNSRQLTLICSILYEEIFNTTLDNFQLPIRDNIQPLEDILHNNKNNKIISLSVDIINKSCKIIRAGKGLFSYINNNLFDLFPLIFKQFQINHFMSVIFENFDVKTDENLVKNKQEKKNETILNGKTFKRKAKALNNNNKKKNFIEIKLIICENILSKIYFKFLTLKLMPLFSTDFHHFIIFDGFFDIKKYTFITLQDFEEYLSPKEKIIGVSEPNMEENNETYSMPINQYISMQNSEGFEVTKISTFNISIKSYNIYVLNKKEKTDNTKNKILKPIDQPRPNKMEDDEEEEQNSYEKKNSDKVEKIVLLEDNASVSSQQSGINLSTGISSIGIRNKKKDNIFEYGGFNRIKNIDYLIIIIIIILLIIEYFYLLILKNQSHTNSITFLQYREFYKLYFQLFSLILGVSCIEYNNDCLRMIDPFSFQFNEIPLEEIKKFFVIQNKFLAKQMMEKKVYLVNIHNCIGNKKYNKLFNKEIQYLRLGQNFSSGSLQLYITNVKMQFSEALLVMCNSFQLLAEQSGQHKMNILNGENEPFFDINKQLEENKYNEYLSNYKKDFYEMILNYKNYFREFNLINNELDGLVTSKSIFIKVFVYVYITVDTSLIMFVGCLIYLYTITFEIIFYLNLNNI